MGGGGGGGGGWGGGGWERDRKTRKKELTILFQSKPPDCLKHAIHLSNHGMLLAGPTLINTSRNFCSLLRNESLCVGVFLYFMFSCVRFLSEGGGGVGLERFPSFFFPSDEKKKKKKKKKKCHRKITGKNPKSDQRGRQLHLSRTGRHHLYRVAPPPLLLPPTLAVKQRGGEFRTGQESGPLSAV